MALKIITFSVNMFQENCYLIYDNSKEGIIIDNGACNQSEKEHIINYIEQNRIVLKQQIYTHGHFDHIWGSKSIYDRFKTSLSISHADVQLYQSFNQQLQDFLGIQQNIDLPPVARQLNENDLIYFGEQQLQVIATPGHTPGGCCFYCPANNILFSGDSLFFHSIGRTDFPGGNQKCLIQNIKNKILTLPESTIVYPGHGPSTTIGEEKTHNIYLRS